MVNLDFFFSFPLASSTNVFHELIRIDAVFCFFFVFNNVSEVTHEYGPRGATGLMEHVLGTTPSPAVGSLCTLEKIKSMNKFMVYGWVGRW